MEFRSGEINIAKDVGLHHRGVLATKVEIILTNERVIIRPLSFFARISGARALSISLKDIESVDVRGIDSMLSIEIKGTLIRFSGSGPLRMNDPIRQQVARISGAQSTSINEQISPIILQGDVQIFIRKFLSSKGEIILTSNTLKIESKGIIENLLFKTKRIDENLNNITDLEYQKYDRILTISFKSGEMITLSGEFAAKLNVQLSSIQNGNIEGSNPLTSGIEVTLHQGVLAPAQVGLLVVNPEQLFFSPTGHLDNIVGSKNFRLLLQNIQRVEVRGWPEKRLALSHSKGSLSFDIDSPEKRLNNLKEILMMREIPLPFEDMRSEHVNLEAAITFLTPHDIDPQQEHPIFINRSIQQFSKNSFRTGWLLLTQKSLYFLADEKDELWEASLIHLSQIRLRKADIQHFALSVKGERHHFYFNDPDLKVEFLWEKISEIRPPPSLIAARNNQPLERLLGEFDVVLFRKDGKIFLDIEEVELKIIETEAYTKLRIFTPKLTSIGSMVQGMPLDIELAKDGGRYKMTSVLTELFLTLPDPLGRHYISLEPPEDIIFYNQRSNFRIDIYREMVYTIFKVIHMDNPTPGNGLILEDIWQPIGSGNGKLTDLSMGGCSLILPYNFKIHAPPKLVPIKSKANTNNFEGVDNRPREEVFDPTQEVNTDLENIRFQFEVELNSSTLVLKVRIIHIRPLVTQNGSISFRYGLEFVELDKKTTNSLNQEILLFEREFLRNRRKKQT